MTERETGSVAPVEVIGTWMWIAWVIFLGPGGFLLLIGVAYAMLAQNLALGIVAGILLFLPILLTVPWFPVGWLAVHCERREFSSRWKVACAWGHG
jgi:hypothetical protein